MSRQHTILLVEDDPNDAFLIQRAFRHANAANSIQHTSNGEEAVSYLTGAGKYSDRQSHPLPILVLLDLKMPRMSGFEVLEWLRKQSQFSALPVIVLTASAHTRDIELAYKLGANSYLVKPVNDQSMVEMIKVLDMYWLLMNTPLEGHRESLS